MKISIDPVIASRINAAWRKLSSQQQAEIAPAILQAHQQAVTVSQTGKAPAEPAASHSLLLAHSALSNDSDNVLNSLEAGVVVDVGPDGVIWGTGKYEQLDPGWVEAFAVFLESILAGKHPFVTNPATIPIPENVQIGLVGDWGTGDWRTSLNPAPGTDVANHMGFLSLDLTIHLGDVYYAGTSDQRLSDFVVCTNNDNHSVSHATVQFGLLLLTPVKSLSLFPGEILCTWLGWSCASAPRKNERRSWSKKPSPIGD